MEVRSIYKFARISPKKARDVAREIQGLPVSDALDALNFTPRKAAFLIGKTLKSAVANAENNHDLVADTLRVKEANISDGPSFRRFKPRARGSAGAIRKRTSHIYIVLTDEAGDGDRPTHRPKPAERAASAPETEPAAPAAAPAPEAAAPASESESPAPAEASATEPPAADSAPDTTPDGEDPRD